MRGKAMLELWGREIEHANRTLGQEGISNARHILELAKLGKLIPSTRQGRMTPTEQAAHKSHKIVFRVDAVVKCWPMPWRNIAAYKFQQGQPNHIAAKNIGWSRTRLTENLSAMYEDLEHAVDNIGAVETAYALDAVLRGQIRRKILQN